MQPLVRDRATLLLYAQLGVWGFYLFGFGPVVPLLRDEQGTGAAVASLHSTGAAVGTLIGGFLFARLAGRFGRPRVLWCSLAGVAAGLLAFCLFRPFPLTVSAVVVTSAFGTMVVVAVNASLMAHHGPAAPAALSEANAVAAGLGVISPLVIGFGVSVGLGWRPGLGLTVALIGLAAAAAAAWRIRLPDADRASVGGGGRPDRLPGPYWLAWTMLGCTSAIEVCLSLWSADVLRSHAGMSAGAAAGAVASVMIGMFAGRVVGGRFARRVAPAPLLLGALGLSLAGFALFWASALPALAVTGLVILGLGNAMHYPLGIALALAAAPEQTNRASAYTSYSVAIGYGLAPVALGAVADLVRDPRTAFLLLPIFIAAAAALARCLLPAPERGAAPARPG